MQASGSGAPNVLVARQPIFDRAAGVVAYELLARRQLTDVNWVATPDDSGTTARVIGQAFLEMDVWSITEGLPAFINFTRELLLDGTVDALPSELTVVEVLETVVPDQSVRQACHRLRHAGYRIALDDVVTDDPRLTLLDLADIVKLDFAATSAPGRTALLRQCRDAGVQVLAEKVETPQQQREAERLGCDLFQGYFFQKPAVIGGGQLSGARLMHLQLLRSVIAPEIDRDAIGNVLARDPATAARLAALALPAHIVPDDPATLAEHLAHLDDQQIVRSTALLVVLWFGQQHPRPLLDAALIRAHFCEQLARCVGTGPAPLAGYLAGMCSLLDALVNEPLADVVGRIHADALLSSALLHRQGVLGQLLELVIAYEHANWAAVRDCAGGLGVDESLLGPMYLQSLAWTRELVHRSAPAVGAGGGW